MNILAMIFGRKHAIVEKKIAYEKARADGNKQAIKSGVSLLQNRADLLVHASNALTLVAEEKNAPHN